MADRLAVLYAKARRGQITSLLHVATGPEIDDETGLSGEFADDLEYAAEVLSESLTLIAQHRNELSRKAPGRERSKPADDSDDLPYMLRVA